VEKRNIRRFSFLFVKTFSEKFFSKNRLKNGLLIHPSLASLPKLSAANFALGGGNMRATDFDSSLFSMFLAIWRISF
jgi:hypothetical protein